MLVGATATLSAIAAASCTYDFDAAFAESPTPGAGGAGASSSTTSTDGGAGATGGQGAQGGDAPNGGGGSGGGELCTNGEDDDGDELVDCQDPACGAFACAPAPPTNWQGPIAFGLVPGGDPLPSCAPVWPSGAVAFDGYVDTPVECSECSCGTPVVNCSLGILDTFTVSQCSGSGPTFAPAGDGVCTPFSSPDLDSFRARPPLLSGAPSCPTQGGAPEPTPPAWDLHAQLCTGAAFGQGCEEGWLCAPEPTVSFAVCIMRTGDEVCPPGYPQKSLLYSSYDDGRSCSACSCAAPATATCEGQTELWTDTPTCSGAADYSVENDNTCTNPMRNEVSGSFRYTALGATAAPCTPSGGAAQGTVTLSAPITVCCLD